MLQSPNVIRCLLDSELERLKLRACFTFQSINVIFVPRMQDALKRHLQSKHSKDDCNQFDKILQKNISDRIATDYFC